MYRETRYRPDAKYIKKKSAATSSLLEYIGSDSVYLTTYESDTKVSDSTNFFS